MSDGPKWRDATSYAKGEKDRVPRTLEAEVVPGIRIVLTRRIHCDGWFFWATHDYTQIVATKNLLIEDLEEAKRRCQDELAASLFALGSAFIEAAKTTARQAGGRDDG